MISIILPVYNTEEYVGRCIESIQNQTYENWEMIIIDNGSTDGSYHICKKYAKEDSRIEVFHQYQNKGVSVARNLGLERVSGEFVTFIDADDWVEKNYLQELLNIQRECEADMVVCGYEIKETREQQEEKELAQESDYVNRILSAEEYFSEYMLQGNTHCWGVLYRRKKIEEIHFPGKVTIGEDLLYLIHAAKTMEKIVVTDYSGYRYYRNLKGVMLKKFSHSYMDQLSCWQKAKEVLIEGYPALENKIDSIIVVSALLVIGKISELSSKEQEKYREDYQQCFRVVKEYGRQRKIRKHLPSGYPLKVFIFTIAPRFYMKLYGVKKSAQKAVEKPFDK